MGRINRSSGKIQQKGSRFKPFRPAEKHAVPLAAQNLEGGAELLAFERGGKRRCVLVSQAIYHHLIQGELGGQPYLVSY